MGHPSDDKLMARFRAAEADAKAKPGIRPVALCATLAECLPENTIYLDETTVHGGINRRHVGNQGPQSYIAPRSGLGQGMGISAGVKLACKDRPVTLLVGDGAFLYNPAVQTLGFARDEKTPFMTIVYNNKGYRAMREKLAEVGEWDWKAFLIVAALFAAEHGPYWDVGLACGILYNWWMVRTKSLGDLILAHGITNACLSLYVVAAGKWEYWA